MECLYNKYGKIIAYIDDDKIWSFNGDVCGYICRKCIFSTNGAHIGFYENGWIMDLNGYQVFFTDRSDNILMKPFKQTSTTFLNKHFLPLQPIFDIPALKPLRKMEWSHFSDISFFTNN